MSGKTFTPDENGPQDAITQLLGTEAPERDDSDPEGGTQLQQQEEYERKLKRAREQLEGREKQAQELANRLAAQESEMARMRQYVYQGQQQQQEPVPSRAAAGQYLTHEEVQALSEAQLGEDADAASNILNRGFDRMQQSFAQQQQEQQAYIQRQNVLKNRIASVPELQDSKSPLSLRAQQLYWQLLSDPSIAAVTPQETFRDPGTGQDINLYIMDRAVLQAKAELGASSNVAEDVARQTSEYALESSSRPSEPFPQTEKTVTIKDLLTTEEINVVDTIRALEDPNYSYKAYAQALEDAPKTRGLLEYRRKTGKKVPARLWRAGLSDE